MARVAPTRTLGVFLVRLMEEGRRRADVGLYHMYHTPIILFLAGVFYGHGPEPPRVSGTARFYSN